MPLPVGTQRARSHESRSSGSSRHSASSSTQGLALRAGLRHFRSQHSCPRRRWRLVRLHPISRWPLGTGTSRCLRKGHCRPAALSAPRGMLRSLAEACCPPAEVLTKLNSLLVEDFPAGKFVTLVYAVIDPASRNLTFATPGKCH